MDHRLKRSLQDRFAKERGACRYPPGVRTRFALVYPNTYFVGMSNLGLHIIYDLLNKRKDTACERFFLPDRTELPRYERTQTPMMSVETQTPLADFAVIGFAISFEMDYFNVVKMLMLSHVRPRAAERTERDPLVIAGGPCATFNPEPLAEIVDAFVIGEGEAIMPALMDAYHAGQSAGDDRAALRRRLGRVSGVYVPALYTPVYDDAGHLAAFTPEEGAPHSIARQWVHDLDVHPAHTVVVTEDTEFNFYLIETARGCGRHCRFCMAGYCFRRPRNRSLAVIEKQVRAALPYGKKIGLMGAAISDYPEIDALCRSILGEGLSMSVASFRADSVTQELVEALAASGLKTLTLAPEAGSARMRAVINKGIEEHHLFTAIDLGAAAHIPNFKLYIMVGLPFEEDADIDAIIDLAVRLRSYMDERGSHGMLTLSVNPFVPKPFTPFQWMPMAGKKRLDGIMKKITQELRRHKKIVVHFESPKEALVQAILARGDRRLSEPLIHAAAGRGAKDLADGMRAEGLLPDDYLIRVWGAEELFPWEQLDMGFSKDYLRQEYERAAARKATPPCFDGCVRCGVCTAKKERTDV
ncbi:radical SAM protein [Selenomonas dianae]|uniref:Radical SAM protein n=1 Tax=Selenomonas dianae TaxID=135079 RepID=A0ABN0T4V0_9FIRM|nr:radical SAM protein [Selenomonas dianae]WLD81728.1 radical SAM protein [Selenomonas dianae]